VVGTVNEWSRETFKSSSKSGNKCESGAEQHFARKAQNYASTAFLSPMQLQPSNQQPHGIKSAVLFCRHDAVTRAHLPLHSLSGALMRREDLLKPDGMSEAIVLGAGVVVFVILILILIVILTHTANPV